MTKRIEYLDEIKVTSFHISVRLESFPRIKIMEAQSFFSGPAQSIKNPKSPLFSTTPTTFSCSCSSLPSIIQSPQHISFKPNFPLASLHLITQTKRNSQFTVSAESIGSTSFVNAVEGDVKTKVRKKNLAVFVSGGGSNFRSIHQASINGSVHGHVVVLVTNNPDCGGAIFAKDNGIPVILFPKTKDASEGFSAEDLVAALRTFKVDFILLAGYLKLIPAELIQAYPRSVFNIHPSLLPAFGGKGYYGMKVHKAVIASGARYSGPTIHHVDEKYDTGRILAQRVVPVLANGTVEELAARVLHEEHKLYVEVAAALCEERVIWREDGVPLIQSKENPTDYR